MTPSTTAPYVPVTDEHGVLLLRPEFETVPEATEHARLVDLLQAGLNRRFAQRQDVAVHERLAWFPDAEDTRIRLDPDIMVVIGRPKADRRSYKAWAEDHVPPAVLIEVKSQDDGSAEYARRLARAHEHGVTEAVLIDPYAPGGVLVSHLRAGQGDPGLRTVAVSSGPDRPVTVTTLGLTIAGGTELVVSDETGVWLDTVQQIMHAEQQTARADQEAARAEQEAARADREAARARRLEQALRDAGIDPDQIPGHQTG
ncbi:hypothetical protein BH23ACT9_BH23ACT9_36910 [soil metagenome]